MCQAFSEVPIFFNDHLPWAESSLRIVDFTHWTKIQELKFFVPRNFSTYLWSPDEVQLMRLVGNRRAKEWNLNIPEKLSNMEAEKKAPLWNGVSSLKFKLHFCVPSFVDVYALIGPVRSTIPGAVSKRCCHIVAAKRLKGEEGESERTGTEGSQDDETYGEICQQKADSMNPWKF